MQFQNSAQNYLRPTTSNNINIRQQVRSRSVSLVVDQALLKAISRLALAIIPVVLLINLIVASATSQIEASQLQAQEIRHQLTDKKIELLATRAALLVRENLEQMAAAKLELYRAEPGQVAQYDHRKHVFRYR